jgi:DNA-directed RNA polymerase subunit RPC12/RpoP
MSPIYNYSCSHCKTKFEGWFLTFDAAKPNEKFTKCSNCGLKANRNFNGETPAYPLAFYGNPEGYHKPAPSKRSSYSKTNKGE